MTDYTTHNSENSKRNLFVLGLVLLAIGVSYGVFINENQPNEATTTAKETSTAQPESEEKAKMVRVDASERFRQMHNL